MSITDVIYLAAVPVFVGSILVEASLARRQQRRVYRRADTVANLAMGIGNRIIEIGWVLVEIAVLTRIHSVAPWDLGTSATSWVVAIIGVDFAYYWYHRAHHEVRLLWAVHVVHHSSEEYNLAVALRQPWLVMTWLPFLAPMALLGVPVTVLAVAYAANLFYQFWIHTQLIDRMPRWYEFVFNTPSHHRVHHGTNAEYLDRNYGGILIIWDRMFRSFEPEVAPVVFGLTKNITTANPLRIATHELVEIARSVRYAGSWRHRLAHVLRGPGWAPSAVAA